MANIGRPGLSRAQKAELWLRWRNGESLSDIGRALGKHAGSIHGVLARHGGISPRNRTRSPRVLSLEEREAISRGIAVSLSFRSIAKQLGRAPSTISREVARHGGRANYRAVRADEKAWANARRPKPLKLASSARLRRIVAHRLSLDWSPEQIAGWLRIQFSEEQDLWISHETIYRSLYVQTRGVLSRELLRRLRSRRMMRRSRESTRKGQPRGQIQDARSIRERSLEADTRARPGHWEGDLVSGSNNSHIATLVDRCSRYTMAIKLASKETASVVGALRRRLLRLPPHLRQSLTWDRGMELANHKDLHEATGINVFFCDPQSPWQRGTNENTNGLLRQYFPRGTDLSGFSQADLDRVAARINRRPRKMLGYETPEEVLKSGVALTC